MIKFLLVMSLLSFLFWIGFKLTGAILATCFWLFIEVPLAFVAFVIGLVLCCTLILLPVGIGCFKTGFKLLIPGI